MRCALEARRSLDTKAGCERLQPAFFFPTASALLHFAFTLHFDLTGVGEHEHHDAPVFRPAVFGGVVRNRLTFAVSLGGHLCRRHASLQQIFANRIRTFSVRA